MCEGGKHQATFAGVWHGLAVWACELCGLRWVNAQPERTLSDQHPEAYSIRDVEEKCPGCRKMGGFKSYLTGRERVTDKEGKELCGYYCEKCGWGNAGNRDADHVTQADNMVEEV